jgi:hypothetical protein
MRRAMLLAALLALLFVSAAANATGVQISASSSSSRVMNTLDVMANSCTVYAHG